MSVAWLLVEGEGTREDGRRCFDLGSVLDRGLGVAGSFPLSADAVHGLHCIPLLPFTEFGYRKVSYL